MKPLDPNVLFNKYYLVVYRHCYGILKNEDIAEVVMDAFVYILNKGLFKDEEEFLKYWRKKASHASIDRLRKTKSRREDDLPADYDPAMRVDESGYEAVIKDAAPSDILVCLQRLPEDDRYFFVALSKLYPRPFGEEIPEGQEWSWEQVADYMEIPFQKFRYRRDKIRTKLKLCIERKRQEF